MNDMSVGPGYIEYDKVCRQAVEDDDVFKTFKQHPAYRQVLEHVSTDLGRLYFKKILNEKPELLDIVIDDNIGSPFKYKFGDSSYSPTTLRYLGIYLDIASFFGSLDDLNVAEIGAGYGGQFVVLDKFWKMKSYTTYDIPSACDLTKKYTSRVGVRTPLTTKPYLIDEPREYDFVMSNFAFTELYKEDQEKYLKLVIKGTPMGFMIVNTEQGYSFQDMLDSIPGSRLLKGISGNDHFIVWGDF
jgi:putative sugar O-methyltransferase